MENYSSSVEMKLSPLDDEDFSDLTKKEISRWAQQLNITPAELYSLTQKDLEQLLAAHLARERDAGSAEKFIAEHEEHQNRLRQIRRARWHRLRVMNHVLKQKSAKSDKGERLQGGVEKRTVWDILAGAALEIESTYGVRTESTDNTNLVRQSGGDIGHPTSTNILYEGNLSPSTDPSPGSILKTSPGKKLKCPATPGQDAIFFNQNQPNQTQQAIGVTFSHNGIDGGPCFVQETGDDNRTDVDLVIKSQDSSGNKKTNRSEIVRTFLMQERDGPIYRPGSPNRNREYPTFMQGSAPSPQRYLKYQVGGGQ